METDTRAQEFAEKQKQAADLQDKLKTPTQEMQIAIALSMKIFTLEKRLESLAQRVMDAGGRSRKADWRSLALLNTLVAKEAVDETAVYDEAEKIQEEDFKLEVDAYVEANALQPKTEPIVAGDVCSIGISFFKDGVEMPDEQVRSIITVGLKEIFPELDAAMLGMKAGETKKFPANLLDKTDEAEVFVGGVYARAVQS